MGLLEGASLYPDAKRKVRAKIAATAMGKVDFIVYKDSLILQRFGYLCTHYDNRKITGYAVATCRDKEVSLTLRTATQKLKTISNFH
jgi:hypothetical protein